MAWVIVAFVWVIGALVAYPIINKRMKDDAKTWEKVWYSAVWPCTLILYIISLIHNAE